MTSDNQPRQQDEPAVAPTWVADTASSARQPAEAEEGGEMACWAHLVCPDCGAMESEGHRPDCPVAAPGHDRRS
jgi:hypothetical protein